MKAVVQVCGLCAGFFGCVSAAVSLQVWSWKRTSDDGSVILTSDLFENLWMSCAEDSTGSYSCWYFPSLFALPGYIQVCRALIIASIVLGTFGLIFTLIGMECSKIGGENYLVKGRLAVLGGVFFILEGVCTMIAVSWYASNIIQEFYNPLYDGIKFELGEGLYIGWCSATLALIGGCCLLCVCGKDSNSDKVVTAHSPSALSRISRKPSMQHRLSSYI
ncbi:claudin-15-like isoform 2-T2 [Clarias gariepinus]|uniref:claudin-15-like isoform X2 n=1 Tax=Clarias gariepinus TaxID=13013 RepID=UPI00234D140B|nr:claudin-15-like isoform X2 [Clarias gariepinus]